MIAKLWRWLRDGNPQEHANKIKTIFEPYYPGCRVVIEDGDYATKAAIYRDSQEPQLVVSLYHADGRGLVGEARHWIGLRHQGKDWGATA